MPMLSRLWSLAACILLACPAAHASDGVSPSQLLIGQSITLQGGKNDYGTAVLSGVQAYFQAANKRGGVNGRTLVLKTLDNDNRPAIDDAGIAQMAAKIGQANAQLVINHGSAGMYERLIRQARAMKLPAAFSAVNSGSAQLVKHLGPAAQGMVFSQVVPSPWERKSAITREYQEVFAREKPGQEFSYGSLEGYLTAKALVAALQLAGPKPTRDSFVKAIHGAGGLVVADGLRAVYDKDSHRGLTVVDLAIVTRDLKFRH